MKKTDCVGCYNNYYNGNNDIGVRECLYFSSAKIVRRKQVHINQQPPWTQRPISVPDCYRQGGYIFVPPNRDR